MYNKNEMETSFLDDGILTASRRKDVRVREVKFREKEMDISKRRVQEVEEVTPKASQTEKQKVEELRARISEIAKVSAKTRLGIRVGAVAALLVLAMYIVAVIVRDFRLKRG
jgi:hypothetical protein